MHAHCDKLSIRFKTHIRPKVSSECSKVYNNIIDGISKISCKMDFSDYYDEQHDTGVVKIPKSDKKESLEEPREHHDTGVVKIPKSDKKESLEEPREKNYVSQIEPKNINIMSEKMSEKISEKISESHISESQENSNNCEYKTDVDIGYHTDDEYVIFD